MVTYETVMLAAFRRRIGFKLTGVTVLSLTLVAGPSLWLLVQRERQVLGERIDELGTALVNECAAVSQEPLAGFDYPRLETYVERLVLDNPDVYAVCIRRQDGRIVAEQQRTENAGKSARLFVSRVEIDSGTDAPLPLGTVYLQVSTQRLEKVVAGRAREVAAIAGLMSLAVALSLMLALKRFLLRPLRRLDRFSEQLRDGMLEESLDLDSEDEIGRLALSLDKMRAGLHTSQQALRSRNAELGEALEQLSAALDGAQAADRAKADFLATMSHEIRTPLNGILGMSELLLETELGSEQQEFTRTMQSCGEVLLGLVNDVLDFSKIEAGKLSIEHRSFSLRAVVSDSARIARVSAEKKGLRFESKIEDLDDEARGDEIRLRQVLVNLLFNAVKFTSHGSVTLRLRSEPGAERQGWVRFEVEDTGIGIAGEARDSLFSPFVQADCSTTRQFGGSGLGLAICRRLVEGMGGEIDYRSRVGIGSTFYFSLPVQVENEEEAQLELQDPSVGPASDPAADWSGIRALVAEDNPVNLRLARRVLENRGFQVTVATNGLEAVECYSRERPGIILMDCHMPTLDGYEATRQIRELETLSGEHTPIVALTANALEGEREHCLNIGMDDYLTKPLDSTRLDEMLHTWLGEGRGCVHHGR